MRAAQWVAFGFCAVCLLAAWFFIGATYGGRHCAPDPPPCDCATPEAKPIAVTYPSGYTVAFSHGDPRDFYGDPCDHCGGE